MLVRFPVLASLPVLGGAVVIILLDWELNPTTPTASVLLVTCLIQLFRPESWVNWAERMKRNLPVVQRPLKVAEGKRSLSQTPAEITGTIRVMTPLKAPISGKQCAAYGLTGQVAGGAMSDAFLGDFEILSKDGDVYRIKDGATLRVPLSESEKIKTNSTNFTDILQPLLLTGKDHQANLREGLLLDGDEVSLCGIVSPDEGQPSSYRAVRQAFLLGESPQVELIIQKR